MAVSRGFHGILEIQFSCVNPLLIFLLSSRFSAPSDGVNCYFLLDLGSISDSLYCSKVRRFPDLRGADRWAKLRGTNTDKQQEARRLSLKQLRQHTKRSEIEPDYYIQITEGIIIRLKTVQ